MFGKRRKVDGGGRAWRSLERASAAGPEGGRPVARRTVVLLAVGTAVLTGALSAVGAFLITQHISESYDDAIKLQLEQKALAFGQTASAFLEALGPEALPPTLALLEDTLAESEASAERDGQSPPLSNAFLGFEGWVVDPAEPGGFSLVFREAIEPDAFADDDPEVQHLVGETSVTGVAAAALDEEHQHIHVSVPIDLGDGTQIIAVGTLSAEEEFAFFAAQRDRALRDGIILAVAIIVFVSLVAAAVGVILSRHLTSRERAEAALFEQTRRDPLTGVFNHAAVMAELRGILSRSDGSEPCAVAMADVDGMKATNDTYGHQAGDKALLTAAAALSQNGALLGRYGGDEFVAVLPGADREEALRFQDAVRAQLRDATIADPESGLDIPISVSMGLAVYPEEAETAVDLIKLADQAMYAWRERRPPLERRKGMPRRGDERAARIVGEMVPFLTSEEELNDKLRQVAHRLCAAGEYDGVNFELLVSGSRELLASSSFAHVPDEQLAAWERHERREGPNALLPILERTHRPVIIGNSQEDKRVSEAGREMLTAAGFRSLLAAPMLWRGELSGILTVLSKRESAFGPRDAQLLTTVATQVAAIVRMETLVEDLQSTSSRLAHAHEETVLLLAAASELYDASIPSHFHGVRSVAVALARELGWSEERATELGLAAALHDVGKIRVPHSVLAKPDGLSEADWAIMKRHTIWGAELLSERPGFELAAAIARAHHERWDGSGYPDGLEDGTIPEEAAIVAVADAFDAMIGDRVYHKRRSVEEAVAEIVGGSGRQFSPQVVEALRRLHERGALVTRERPEVARRAA